MRLAKALSVSLSLVLGAAVGCGGSQDQVEDPNMGGTPPAAMPPAEPPPAAAPPPAEPPPAATAEPQAAAPAPKTVLDVANEAGNFTTLITLVKAAELEETLKGAGPYTIFAPSDEAFAKVPKKDIEAWQKPENKEKLTKVLTYHVLPQKVSAEDAKKLDKKTAKTVNGKELKITVKDDAVMLDGKAKVVKADVEASNGVIHVVDVVLMPK